MAHCHLHVERCICQSCVSATRSVAPLSWACACCCSASNEASPLPSAGAQTPESAGGSISQRLTALRACPQVTLCRTRRIPGLPLAGRRHRLGHGHAADQQDSRGVPRPHDDDLLGGAVAQGAPLRHLALAVAGCLGLLDQHSGCQPPWRPPQPSMCAWQMRRLIDKHCLQSGHACTHGCSSTAPGSETARASRLTPHGAALNDHGLRRWQ